MHQEDIYIYKIESLQEWNDDLLMRYASYLPNILKDKYLRYIRWEDKQIGILSFLLLKYAFKIMHINKSLNELQYSNFKKPYINDGPFFNISHSGNIAICAISESIQIGIDIERINPIEIDIFLKCFSNNEVRYLNEKPDLILTRFYEIWTKKEAVLKADGIGISGGLKNIDTLLNPINFNNLNWYLTPIHLIPNYFCTLAGNKFARYNFIEITEDELVF